MAMGENIQFGDFNLDQLLAPAPSSYKSAACHNIGITPSSAKRSRLAERIAQSDELVNQVKQLQSHHQQLADLQRTAQEVTDLYQREKQQRLDLEVQAKQFGERCEELEKELDAQVLNCESLQAELSTRGLPVDARDVVEVLMQLAQKVGVDSGLMRREHNMIRKLKDYCKTAGISLPSAKSLNTGSTRRKAVGTSQITQATQTTEVITPKAPAMYSIGVQIEMRKEMRDQGTQHKNTTTTRGTTTASFIKYHDVGTCFPEPKDMPNVLQILDEMLSWHDRQTIEPLSPICDTLLPQEKEEACKNSVGTCTTLCNVQREVDFVSIIQPTHIKVSNSRPPSRGGMFDSVKDEASLGCPSSYAREILHFLPHPDSCLSNVPAHAFEELWQVFGQMLLGLLQCRSTASQSAPPSVSQADFTKWLYALYEGTQSQEKQMANSTVEDGKMEQERRFDGTTTCVDASIETEPETSISSEALGVDLRPILLPAKNSHLRIRAATKRKRKGGRSCHAISKSRRKTQQKVVEQVKSGKTQCDTKEKTEQVSDHGVHIKTVKSPNRPRGLELHSIEATNEYSPNADIQINRELDLEQNSACRMEINPMKSNQKFHEKEAALNPNEELQQFPELNTILVNTANSFVKFKYIKEPDPKKANAICDARRSPENSAKEINSIEQWQQSLKKDDSLNSNGELRQCPKLNTVTLDPPDSCRKSSNDKPAQNPKDELHKFPEAAESAIQFISNLTAFKLTNCDNLEMELDEEELRLLELTREEPLNSPFEINHWNTENTVVEKLRAETSNVVQSLSLETEMKPTANHKMRLSLFGSDSEAEDPVLEYHQSIISLRTDSCSEDDTISESGSLIIDEGETSSSHSPSPTSSPLFSPSPPPKRIRNSSRSESPPLNEVRITRLRAKQLLMEEQIRLKKINQLEVNEQDTLAEMPREERKSEEEQKIACISFLVESPSSPTPCSGEKDEWEHSKSPVEIPLEHPGILYREPSALMRHIISRTKAEPTQKAKNYKPQLDALGPKIVEFLSHSLDLESSYRDFALALQKITKDDTVITNALITTFGQMEEKDHKHIARFMKALHYISISTFPSYIENFINALEMRLFRSGKEKPLAKVALRFVKLYLKLIRLQSSLMPEFYENPARLLLVKILYHYERDMAVLVLEVLTEYPTVLPHREERGYDESDPIITVIKHLLMNRKYDMHDPKSAERFLLSKLRFEYHFQPFQPTRQEVVENFVEKIKAGKLHQHLSYAFALFCRRSYSHSSQVIKEVLAKQLVPLASSYSDLCTQCENYDERLQTLLQCISMIVKELPLDTDVSGYVVLFKRFLMAAPRSDIEESVVQAILRLQRFGFKYVLDSLQNYKPNYRLTPLTRAMMRSFAVRREKYQRPQFNRIDRGKQHR